MGLSGYRLRTAELTPVPAAELAPAAAPGVSPSTLAAVPVLAPGGASPLSFLYSQLQAVPFSGQPNTWNQPQEFQATSSSAYNLTVTTTAPSWTGVKQRWGSGIVNQNGAGWEIGLLDSQDAYDPNGNCFYWLDLKASQRRLMLDSQGQLTVLGTSPAGSVNNNFRIQNSPASGASQAGLGVGVMFELVDAGGHLAGSALNCSLSDPTSNAATTVFGLYALNQGTGNLCMALSGSGLMGLYGPTPQLTIPFAPSTNVNQGTVMLGAGGFAGLSGSYVGNGSGTFLAINSTGGFAGRFIDCQAAGVPKFIVTSAGNCVIGGALQHAGSTAGFFGTSPIAKINLTGSKASGGALASLIAAMVAYGLATDSTSA